MIIIQWIYCNFIIANFILQYINYIAGTTGLEPATFCVTGRRSNQLSYAPKNQFYIKTVDDVGLEPTTPSV